MPDEVMTNDEVYSAYIAFASNVLQEQLSDIENLLDHVRAMLTERPETSSQAPFMQDFEISDANPFLQHSLQDAVTQFEELINSMMDYIESIFLQLRHDHFMIQPTWSLVRGLMEAALLSCWIIDAKQPAGIRTVRRLALLPSIAQGAVKTADTFRTIETEARRLRASRENLIKHYESNGVEFVREMTRTGQAKDTLQSLRFDGHSVPLKFNKTALAAAYIPGSQHMYPLLSSASHSEFWMTNSVKGIQASDPVRVVLSVVLPMMQIGLAYTTSVCDYFGLDNASHRLRNLNRQEALMSWDEDAGDARS